jgi:hypothetical protein
MRKLYIQKIKLITSSSSEWIYVRKSGVSRVQDGDSLKSLDSQPWILTRACEWVIFLAYELWFRLICICILVFYVMTPCSPALQGYILHPSPGQKWREGGNVSSKMLVPMYETTWCHNPENHNMMLHLYENHKSSITSVLFEQRWKHKTTQMTMFILILC